LSLHPGLVAIHLLNLKEGGTQRFGSGRQESRFQRHKVSLTKPNSIIGNYALEFFTLQEALERI
jgi:hypothetical protein